MKNTFIFLNYTHTQTHTNT